MKRLDAYILQEVATPTIFALVFVSCVVLMTKMLSLVGLVASGGMFWGTLLVVSALTAMLNVTLPASFLIGCASAFNRLSSDAEVVAMRSLGISVRRMVSPALVMGGVLSIFLIFNNLFLSPWAYRSTKAIALHILLNRKNYGVVPGTFTEVSKGLTIYVKRIDGRWMRGVIIFDMREKDKTRVVEAKRGMLKKTPFGGLVMVLKNGKILTFSGDRVEKVSFEKLSQELLGGKGGLSKRPPKRELPLGELLRRMEWEKRNRPKDYRETLVHLHKRFSMALAPLVFCLVAVPLSISFHRKERWGALAVSLGVFFLYFSILSISQNLVHRGLSPFLAAWAPDLTLGALGTWLLLQKD